MLAKLKESNAGEVQRESNGNAGEVEGAGWIVFDQDFIDRFWARVNKLSPDGCWEWTGPISDGYGRANRDNMRDKAKKGRARGSRHPNAKYDEQTVLKIKKALTSKAQYEVADEFGIPRSTIAAIATGRLWGHVVLRGGE